MNCICTMLFAFVICVGLVDARASIPSGSSSSTTVVVVDKESGATPAKQHNYAIRTSSVRGRNILTPSIGGSSSPGVARLLTELFGGVDLNVNLNSLGRDETIAVRVGDAATRCQYQSPCYDARCRLCYDPLLRIHGRCGGASYFTCRGTLPRGCLPFTCSNRAGRYLNMEEEENEISNLPVFVKNFPRFRDPYCLNKEHSSRKLSDRVLDLEDDSSDLSYHPRDVEGFSDRSDSGEIEEEDSGVFYVPEAITPCQSFDLCVDHSCGRCYDAYLSSHVGCGQMSHYDCALSLPRECRPLKCTQDNFNGIFSAQLDRSAKEMDELGEAAAAAEDANPTATGAVATREKHLFIRDFAPLKDGYKNCV